MIVVSPTVLVCIVGLVAMTLGIITILVSTLMVAIHLLGLYAAFRVAP